MKRLADRVALVTGAGQGVGLGIARALGRDGASVVVLDVAGDRAAAAVAELAELDVAAIAVIADVSRPDEVASAVEASVTRFGRLDIVVNNAHTVVTGRLLEVTEADAMTVWSTGFLGTFNVMKAAKPHLGRGSSIINVVSSVMLKADTSGFGMYAATKTAIRSLTRTAAVEWGPLGIRVNALSPQTTSPAWEEWSGANPAAAAKILSEIPLGQVGDPEHDVGPVAVFLASEAARYISGSLVLADGGRGHLR